MMRPAMLLSPMNVAPLPEQMADSIVDAIAEGRIAPGTRLMEAELALALGVSRVPLREAFRILHSQGLVAITPRRGTRVIDCDEAWIRDLRQVRLAIERLATAQAAQRLHEDREARTVLDDAIEGIRRALATGDLLATNAADIAFHGRLVAFANSPLLSTLWHAIRRHLVVLFALDVRRVDTTAIISDHVALRDAMLSATPEALERAITHHIYWEAT
jgi:DNA-binding GntR family transcriptional regulator